MSTADPIPVTQPTTAAQPASWKKIFFIKRRPRLRTARNLERPADNAALADKQAYEAQLEKAGFVTEASLAKEGLAMTDELRADLEAMEAHLLPDFWEQDYEAVRYQNLYYLYQWIFIFGALLTTITASGGVYVFESNPNADLFGQRLTELLQILTAVLSGFAATVSFLSATQAPQENWFEARTKAENLRSLYFLYLARRDPFNLRTSKELERQLDRKVLDILTDQPDEQQGGGS